MKNKLTVKQALERGVISRFWDSGFRQYRYNADLCGSTIFISGRAALNHYAEACAKLNRPCE